MTDKTTATPRAIRRGAVARASARYAAGILLGVVISAPDVRGEQPSTRITVEVVAPREGLADQIRDHLSISTAIDQPDISDARIQTLHQRARSEIKDLLEALGYYMPTIETDISRDGNQWTAQYQVDPGKPVLVRRVDVGVVGDHTDPMLEALVTSFPLRPGDVLDHRLYAQAKRDLLRVTAERGYFDGKLVASTIEVDLAAQRADIALRYETGRRYSLGAVQFPDTVIGRRLLDRYVPFSPGEPYTEAAVLELQNALMDSDYFESVSVEPQRKQAAEGDVPIAVALQPRKPSRYSVGAGFGTDTGPRARAGWESRYWNDRGHRIFADLRVSQVLLSLGGRYTIPMRDPRLDQLSFSSTLLEEDTDSALSRKLQMGAAYSTTLRDWRTTVGLDYLIENFDVSRDTDTSRLLVPRLNISRVWSDARARVQEGQRLEIELLAAEQNVLSDVSFVQARIHAKFIRTFFSRTRLITRAELGAISVSNFERLPASFRFFAGGDNSVRGFDLESLGPKDRFGAVIGGRYLTFASVELEQPIKGKWSGALFSDVGNAFNDFSEPLEYSAGAGVRWQSPIGPVRLDVAAGISDPDLPIRLHFILGPDL